MMSWSFGFFTERYSIIVILYQSLIVQARYSVLNRRYPCQLKDIRYLGGLELQTISNFNQVKYPEYLASDNKWTGLVPLDLQNALTPDQWVTAFRDEHRLHQGLSSLEAKKKYILTFDEKEANP